MKRAIAAAALLLSLAPSPAQGFSINSGFTEGCHERITGLAFNDFLLGLPVGALPVPQSTTWREIAEFMFAVGNIDPSEFDERDRFMLVSLIVGIRAPDTDGHSVTNIEALRQLHSDPSPEGQYAHALRGPADDRAEGNTVAIAGTRARIRALFEQGQALAEEPFEAQVITGTVYLDFYGRVPVDVWGPLFYLGQAAHALQDSFSHTIRDEASGLRQIAHVLNYADALSSEFDENRDGLAHSDSMDDCTDPESQATFMAAIEATLDLMYAARAVTAGLDPDALTHVLDKWLTLKPGCRKDNDFCGNTRLLSHVRKKQTEPYLEAFLGCRASPRGRPPAAVWLTVALLAALALIRRSRRRGSSRSRHR